MRSNTVDTRSSWPARLPAAGLVAAPLVWLAGWVVMRLGGSAGPNIGWDVAHALWIVSFVLFGAAAYGLYRMAGSSSTGRVALAVAFTGAATLVVQMVIDLAVGWRAADKAAMSDRYDEVFAVPGVELVFFMIGPMLLFAGLLALVVVAAARHTVPVWRVLLVVTGIGLMAAGRQADGVLRLVEGLGAVLLWLALAPLAGRVGAAGVGQASWSGRRRTSSTAP
ncbi:hypothetical protein [Plantactinospora sp. GCM10030261]|uniref:hypothetical protein n=1 Tax=Plantactinospora sp. GCM10030261 TaxID=3273420 RepID=UPI0036232847